MRYGKRQTRPVGGRSDWSIALFDSLRTRRILSGALCCVVVAAAVPAKAGIIQVTQRKTVFTIDPWGTTDPAGGLSLPAASMLGSGPIDTDAGTLSVALALKTAGATDGAGNMQISTFTTGQVTTQNVYSNGPVSGSTYAVTVRTGQQGGTFGFNQLLPPGNLSGSTQTSYAALGNNNMSLTVLGGGTGVVMAGGIYDAVFSIVGNWTSAASTLSFVTPGPGFATVQNFVYSSTTNRTTLELLNTNYQNGGPRAQFTLNGMNFSQAKVLLTNTFTVADVPEPAGATVLLAGLGTLALRRRRGAQRRGQAGAPHSLTSPAASAPCRASCSGHTPHPPARAAAACGPFSGAAWRTGPAAAPARVPAPPAA